MSGPPFLYRVSANVFFPKIRSRYHLPLSFDSSIPLKALPLKLLISPIPGTYTGEALCCVFHIRSLPPDSGRYRPCSGCISFPDRSAALQVNVLRRADPLTLSAGNTGIRHIKFLCMDAYRIKQIVHDSADQPVRNRNNRLCKFLSAPDHGRRLRDPLLRLFNDFACRFPVGVANMAI